LGMVMAPLLLVMTLLLLLLLLLVVVMVVVTVRIPVGKVARHRWGSRLWRK